MESRTMRIAIAAMAVGLACVASADPAEEPWVDQLGLGPWQEGRATFYGNEEYNGDTFSIDEGHCEYGSIPSPRYIAALSTWSGFGGDWDKSNCGRCFEIKCDPDGEWGKNCRGDRVQASVVVVVTDKCPCDDRNRRWCCGDEPHFDLSFEAFGEVGNHGGGVISTAFRPIECPDVGRGGELLLSPEDQAKPSGNASRVFRSATRGLAL